LTLARLLHGALRLRLNGLNWLGWRGCARRNRSLGLAGGIESVLGLLRGCQIGLGFASASAAPMPLRLPGHGSLGLHRL
jgi:hypothetical protein